MIEIIGTRRILPLLSAWVLCIDTTPSVDPRQFQMMKEATVAVVDTDVHSGDTVWVMRIGDDTTLSQAMRMPPPARHPIAAEQRLAKEALDAKKREVRAVIERVPSSKDRTSNLTDAAERALIAIREHGERSATLVFATDGLNDPRGKGASVKLPEPSPGLRADGVRVLLLLGYPTSVAQRATGLSPGELHRQLSEEWTGYFRHLGATTRVQEPAVVSELQPDSLPGGGTRQIDAENAHR